VFANGKQFVYGIDLGTTFSCVAKVNSDGVVTTLPMELPKDPLLVTSSLPSPLMPSVALYRAQNEVIIGTQAKEQNGTIEFIKRKIGSEKSVQVEIGNNSAECTPEEISAFILKQLVKNAKDTVGDVISEAVITVPAYYGSKQRQAVKDAAKCAGISVAQIVNEPTAAAIYYSTRPDENNDAFKEFLDDNEEETIMVYDLGGGTFDVTIAKMSNGKVDIICSEGDIYLGGKDWDKLLMDYILVEYAKSKDIDVKSLKTNAKYIRIRERIKRQAVRIKHSLSEREHYPVGSLLGLDEEENDIIITREGFEKKTAGLLERTISYVKYALENEGVLKDENGIAKIDKILLVGGSTRMPQCTRALQKVEAIDKNTPMELFEPDLAVAKGAAILAGFIANDTRSERVKDVTNRSYGIKIIGDRVSNHIFMNDELPKQSEWLPYSNPKPNMNTLQFDIYESRIMDKTGEKIEARGVNISENPVIVRIVGTWDSYKVKLSARLQLSLESILTVEVKPQNGSDENGQFSDRVDIPEGKETIHFSNLTAETIQKISEKIANAILDRSLEQ
jgi:molecular chaperone DnaK